MNVSTLSNLGGWFRPTAAPQPLKADDVGPWPALADLGKVRAPDGYVPSGVPASSAAPVGAGQATTTAAQAGSTVPGPVGAAITPLVKQQLEGVVDRLAAKGIKFEGRLTSGTLKEHMLEEDGWRFDAVTPKGASVVLMRLDDVRVLDGVEGAPTLTADERAQLGALEALYAKGYKRECQQYLSPIHPASILNTLRDGYEVYLYPKDAANPHACKTPDHLHALAFFEGVGPSDRLANRPLAEALKQASDRGMRFHTRYLDIAPHQVYRESRGPSTEILVSRGTVPVATTEAALTDLDKLDAHLGAVDSAWRKYAEPVMKRRGLSFEKDYLPRIARADDAIPVNIRVAVAAAMIDRFKQAIAAQGIFTREVEGLYGAIRERAGDTPDLVRMAARVLPRIDKMSPTELVALAKDSPSLSKVAASDPVRTTHLESLLGATGSLGALIPCLDALEGPRETLDDRALAMLSLIMALPAEERDMAADHFRAMKDMGGETLEENVTAYLSEIARQQLRGRKDVAWDVAPPAPAAAPATVEVADDHVMVGGLRVPRRA